jgi:ribosome-associated protein
MSPHPPPDRRPQDQPSQGPAAPNRPRHEHDAGATPPLPRPTAPQPFAPPRSALPTPPPRTPENVAHGVEIAPGLRVADETLSFSYARSSGPGGQNVNKVSTKAVLRVAIAALPLRPLYVERLLSLAGHRLVNESRELLFASDAGRSQESNRQHCLDELRKLLISAMTLPKTRKKRKPSRAAKARRLDAKKHRGEIKRFRRGEE